MADSALSVERGPAGRAGPGLAAAFLRAAVWVNGARARLADPGVWLSDRLRTALLGLGKFLLLAPALAVVRQVVVLAMAGVVGFLTDVVETELLPLLPVDPVYGGAGLRVLGGIEPRGLAMAGPIGALLHLVLPVVFAAPDQAAPGAAISALVGPGVTVLARVCTALLATTVLLTAIVGAATCVRRPAWRVAATLAQIWLLFDLAHETALGVRDLESTGLPFALAALAPVDAQGQRVLLTTHLEALPDGAIACLSAALAVAVCLLGAACLYGGARLVAACLRRQVPTASGIMAAARHSCTRPRRALAGLPRLATLTAVAALLSASPLGALAEGEMAVLMPAPEPILLLSAVAPEAEPPTVQGDAPTPPETAVVAATVEPTPAPTAAPPAVPAGSQVVVEGSGYQYTLKVDGRPTVVRGMGYNPWYASLPVEERQQRYRRDFSAMREIGVNTLEGWFQNQFDEVTLDEAQRQGLKVIMPFELNQDYDYSDPAVKAMFRQQVTDWVLRYKDHPAVLMWGPGNEVMHRLIFPTAVQGQRDPAREKRADDFATFYVELMDMIRALDPNHPIVYRDAEDLYFARFRAALLRDGVRRPWFIYGANVYTQRIAADIERWPTQGVDAPLLISEFSPGGSGAAERPGMFAWYWSTIRAHPERVLGGVVYTWTTQGPEDLDRVFGLTNEAGVPVDGSIAALRQLFQAETVGKRRPS